MNEQAKSQITHLVCYGWTETSTNKYRMWMRKGVWQAYIPFDNGIVAFLRD